MHRRRSDREPSLELWSDHEDPSTVDMEIPRYWYEGECLGCGQVLPLTDRDLCTDCNRCFDRDLLRLREWGLSSLAAGVPAEDLETLRRRVIAQHGKALELLVPGITVSNRNEER